MRKKQGSKREIRLDKRRGLFYNETQDKQALKKISSPGALSERGRVVRGLKQRG